MGAPEDGEFVTLDDGTIWEFSVLSGSSSATIRAYVLKPGAAKWESVGDRRAVQGLKEVSDYQLDLVSVRIPRP